MHSSTPNISTTPTTSNTPTTYRCLHPCSASVHLHVYAHSTRMRPALSGLEMGRRMGRMGMSCRCRDVVEMEGGCSQAGDGRGSVPRGRVFRGRGG